MIRVSKLTLAGAAVCAVCLIWAMSAQAHNGDIWFQSKIGMQKAIDSKYRTLQKTRCVPDYVNGHRLDENGFQPMWDHFICILGAQPTQRLCWATAHQTGRQWWNIVLTGDKTYYPGRDVPSCSPRDIKRR